jgi:hypothetical protein
MRLNHYLSTLFTVVAALALAAASPAAENGSSSLVPDGAAAVRGGVTAPPVTVQAILVVASDDGATDASLKPYESTLRRVLRFKAYRRVGGGTTKIAVGRNGSIPLGAGQTLEIEIENAWNDQVIAAFKWWNGKLNLANSSMQRPRKSVAVLGGPATADGDGYYAVIIQLD